MSDTCINETIALAEHAAACGADAVVVAPPFYFPITQAELKNYVQHVVEHAKLKATNLLIQHAGIDQSHI